MIKTKFKSAIMYNHKNLDTLLKYLELPLLIKGDNIIIQIAWQSHVWQAISYLSVTWSSLFFDNDNGQIEFK